MAKVKNENFQAKKELNFQILTYRRVIYLKKKLRTCTIQIQPEKIKKNCKKSYFFYFILFSGHARGALKNFDIQFKKEKSKKSKNGFTRTYQILVSLAQILWKW
jgi:hypothetical protein